ncbi:peptidase inhibitor family I36 protein [Kibdelosporangium philippinense]|uniref:peptidase inhibitor family I36 protein n=1 Tax=Kibdelosporangium philippinense TaxID=211113 RepID=UPI0024C338E5|nr:peptidase inhibitor family I36 protein [Kibdelosporangium philippinense]
MYIDNDYQGGGMMTRSLDDVPNLSQHGMNDQVSSVWSNSDRDFCFYEHANYGGRLLFTVLSHDGNLVGRSTANNKASSYKKC